MDNIPNTRAIEIAHVYVHVYRYVDIQVREYGFAQAPVQRTRVLSLIHAPIRARIRIRIHMLLCIHVRMQLLRCTMELTCVYGTIAMHTCTYPCTHTYT